MATDVYYPDASAADGRVYYNGAEDTFANIRAAAGTDHDQPDPGNFILVEAGVTSDTYDSIRRGRLSFNTGALDAGASISSATITLTGSGKSNDFGGGINASIDVVATTPASNSTLANGDYNHFSTTSFANIAYTSWNTAGTNVFTLDANGIANITKAGISNFGVTMGCDTTNTAPTWSSAFVASMNGYYSNHAGTTNDPVLTVTYTVGASSIKTINGLAKASVKTVDGLAIASVKTWNGLA